MKVYISIIHKKEVERCYDVIYDPHYTGEGRGPPGLEGTMNTVSSSHVMYIALYPL